MFVCYVRPKFSLFLQEVSNLKMVFACVRLRSEGMIIKDWFTRTVPDDLNTLMDLYNSFSIGEFYNTEPVDLRFQTAVVSTFLPSFFAIGREGTHRSTRSAKPIFFFFKITFDRFCYDFFSHFLEIP